MQREVLSILEAQKSPLFTIIIAGTGSNIGLLLTGKTTVVEPLIVEIQRALVFVPDDRSRQRMISTRHDKLPISNTSPVKATIPAFCIDAMLMPPDESDRYTASTESPPNDLLSLLDFVGGQRRQEWEQASFLHTLQQTIWCITDELTFEGYFEHFSEQRIKNSLARLRAAQDQNAIRRALFQHIRALRRLKQIREDEKKPGGSIPTGTPLNREKNKLIWECQHTIDSVQRSGLAHEFLFLTRVLPPISGVFSRFRNYPPFNNEDAYISMARETERQTAFEVQSMLNSAGISRTYVRP
jgi:hypothetical protein